MLSINILCFMSKFSFKGDTLYRLIPSGWIDLFILVHSLMGGIQYLRYTFIGLRVCTLEEIRRLDFTCVLSLLGFNSGDFSGHLNTCDKRRSHAIAVENTLHLLISYKPTC